jgi:hypothetical protein
MRRRDFTIWPVLTALVALGACGGDMPTDANVGATSSSTAAPTTSTDVGTTSSTRAPGAPSSTPRTSVTTPSRAGGLRLQFDAFIGGDLVDTCGVIHGQFKPKVAPPYLGSEAGFFGLTSTFLVGDEFGWCVYGFEPDVPIGVTVTAPDSAVDAFRLLISPNATSACVNVDALCRAGEHRHLFNPVRGPISVFSAKSHTKQGPPTAALGGWILTGSPSGDYRIEATQGDTHTVETVTVVLPERPGIDVATVRTGDRPHHIALLVGFPPDSEVPLAFYRRDGNHWNFQQATSVIEVDELGQAVWQFDVPNTLAPGRYCVVAAETIPPRDLGPSDNEYRDPCWFLARFDATFDVD